MKADWRYDRIKQLKGTLSNLLLLLEGDGKIDKKVIVAAKAVLNENRMAAIAAEQARVAAEKAAASEQY